MKQIYDRQCPLARTAEVLEGRWTLLILRDLSRNGPRRFEDFRQSLTGITPSTLSARLKQLEDFGVVTREFYAMNPPRANYVLTDSGKALRPILKAMRAWGEANTSQ
ncbi:MAG: helix-turn-helix domain-containing protein [Pseudomonadota bacterium]